MLNIELAKALENIQPIDVTDRETLEAIAILAKIPLSSSLSESNESKVIDLNPTPEKLAA